MINWINFLHLYQPPTQTKEVIDRIVEESYARIPRLMKKYPRMHQTVNFSGSLLELLEKYGYQSLLVEYQELAAANRIEFVGSAMYHPILALFPEKEMRRQIVLHTEISRKIFGDSYRPEGFYIPEMAYSKKVGEVVRSLGFKWIILDEIHFPKGKPDNSTSYTIEDNGLRVLFRSRHLSKTFPPEYIMKHLVEMDNRTLITAHDGELYGHWHKDDHGYYEKVFTEPKITMLMVSEYLDSLQKEEMTMLREASWESLEEEVVAQKPFVLWNARDNKIHQLLWKFALFAIDIANAYPNDKNHILVRKHVDCGLASCAWWWATSVNLAGTSLVCWNPTEIEKGARELLLAIRSFKTLPIDIRLEAEDRYANLSLVIWKSHWKNIN